MSDENIEEDIVNEDTESTSDSGESENALAESSDDTEQSETVEEEKENMAKKSTSSSERRMNVTLYCLLYTPANFVQIILKKERAMEGHTKAEWDALAEEIRTRKC